MKYIIEVERTFAGKQYENLKPCLRIEFDDKERKEGDESTKQVLTNMVDTLEAFGAEWQKQVLK